MIFSSKQAIQHRLVNLLWIFPVKVHDEKVLAIAHYLTAMSLFFLALSNASVDTESGLSRFASSVSFASLLLIISYDDLTEISPNNSYFSFSDEKFPEGVVFTVEIRTGRRHYYPSTKSRWTSYLFGPLDLSIPWNGIQATENNLQLEVEHHNRLYYHAIAVTLCESLHRYQNCCVESVKAHVLFTCAHLPWLMNCTHNCTSCFCKLYKQFHNTLCCIAIKSRCWFCQETESITTEIGIMEPKFRYIIFLPSKKMRLGFVINSTAIDVRFRSPPLIPRFSEVPIRVLEHLASASWSITWSMRSRFSFLLKDMGSLKLAENVMVYYD